MPPQLKVRVLAHFEPGPRVRERLAREADWLDVRWCSEVPEADDALRRELPEADVIWHMLRPLTAAELDSAVRLRLIQKFGSGVNTIDVAAATRNGVAVANMPGANAASVAEGTVLLMLAAMRRLVSLDQATRAGRGWPSDPALCEHVRDIGSCTVGLVGYGNIARSVERMVSAMGASVLHTSTTDDGTPGWRTLNELLAASDIVSLHLPLTASTHHLIDRAALASMKPTAVLVNTARGAIIDEAALSAALRDGGLAAAGLDVFEDEPTPADNPLLGLDNVVCTPHVSWCTVDTMDRYLEQAITNCRRLAAGGQPTGVVNEPTNPR